MKMLFGYQDVLEVIKNDTPIIQNANKALFLIHQCVDGYNFEKVRLRFIKTSLRDIRESLCRADKAKVVRLQTHKRQLKLIQMEEKEIINDFATRITRLVNQVKACGESITEQYVVAKILCSLTLRFDNIVVVIEESKDLAAMSKNEL